MRVISGSAKSIKLKTLEGLDTRPTQDRIKETLFNMLQGNIQGCRFLDLFSGSGGIGIEAASRGASETILIEKNPKAAEIIKDNLSATHLNERCKLYQGDIFSILPIIDKEKNPFDVIFMDPPYNHEFEKKVIDMLKESFLVDEYTLIIVEASLGTNMDYLDSMGFCITREKKYKTNKHIFIKKKTKE